MDFLKNFKFNESYNDLQSASPCEILDEASKRIRSLFRSETGHELYDEVLSLIFEDGEIVEIQTENGETIYEL